MENQTPTVPTQPVVDVQQTIVPEQSKKSNFLTILLSILLFLAIVIAGFFAYQTQKLSKELNTLKLEPESTFPMYTEPNETVDDPTVNWETFIDKQFGFELKYPENQVTRDNIPTITCPQSLDSIDQSVCEFIVLDSCSQFECLPLIAVDIYKNPNDPNYARNLNDFSGSMLTDKIIDSNINGTPAKMRISQYQSIYGQIYYVSTNGYSYIVYGNSDNSTFNQVISTFKFIN